MEHNGMIVKQVDIQLLCSQCKGGNLSIEDSEIDRVTGVETWFFVCKKCWKHFNISIRFIANDGGYPSIIIDEEICEEDEENA